MSHRTLLVPDDVHPVPEFVLVNVTVVELADIRPATSPDPLPKVDAAPLSIANLGLF